jgi:MFS transporter, DHA1 family, tetracycline resistance protein
MNEPQQQKFGGLAIIAFIVFIDMVGIGLIIPVMPSLIVALSGKSVDQAAEIGGYLLFAYAIMQFLFAPVIGGLSDRFGRRPVLLITLAVLGVDYALMAWAPTLGWLFLGRIISGIMGATWTAANSCVADVVPVERRGAVFGLLGGVGASGFIMGPALGGFFGQFGDRLPFLVASLLALGGALVGCFTLRETLPPDRQRRFSIARANPLGNMFQMAKTPLVLGILITIFFMQLGAQANFSVWSYYGALKFGWDALMIGAITAFYGITLVIMQGLVVGKVIGRFGAERTARISLLFGIPSFLIIAFAPSTTAVVVGIIVGSVTGLCFPAMQSLMTTRIAADAQGELQGAIASIISLTSVIGPILMTSVFSAWADTRGTYFPGAPYILAALLIALASVWIKRTIDRHA